MTTCLVEKCGLSRAEWIDHLRAAVESDNGHIVPDEVFVNDWNTNHLSVRRRIEATEQAESARQALVDLPPEPVMPRLDDVIGPATTFRTIVELVQTVLVPGGVPRTREAWHYRRQELQRRLLTAENYLRSTADPGALDEPNRLSNEVFAERKEREARQQAFTAAGKMSAEIESGRIEVRHGEDHPTTRAEHRALRAARMKEARDLFKVAGATDQAGLDVLLAESIARETELETRRNELGRAALLDPYALRLAGLG